MNIMPLQNSGKSDADVICATTQILKSENQDTLAHELSFLHTQLYTHSNYIVLHEKVCRLIAKMDKALASDTHEHVEILRLTRQILFGSLERMKMQ